MCASLQQIKYKDNPISIETYNVKLLLYCYFNYEPYHLNFIPTTNSEIEKSYGIVSIPLQKYYNIIFGITIHASERMSQRKITNEMLKKTIKNGKIIQEESQKTWDPNGRKLYVYKNMIVVTNFEQNRIVTVYWKIPEWDILDRSGKQVKQQKALNEFNTKSFF